MALLFSNRCFETEADLWADPSHLAFRSGCQYPSKSGY